MEPKDIFCLTASMELFRLFLDDRTEGEGRLSRYGAFVYLLEHANRQHATETAFGQEIHLSAGQLVTSYSELAVAWRWSRDNVRSFFLAMEKTGCVSVERRGKATVVSIPVSMSGTPTLTRLPSREERERLRFIFGTMSLEELADMFESVISKAEKEVGKLEADDPHDIEIGRRLHRLVNHLVLHPSGFFPKDDRVADALRCLFIDDCSSDLAKFFTLLTIAQTDRRPLRQHGVPAIVAGNYDATARRSSRILFSFYKARCPYESGRLRQSGTGCARSRNRCSSAYGITRRLAASLSDGLRPKRPLRGCREA